MIHLLFFSFFSAQSSISFLIFRLFSKRLKCSISFCKHEERTVFVKLSRILFFIFSFSPNKCLLDKQKYRTDLIKISRDRSTSTETKLKISENSTWIIGFYDAIKRHDSSESPIHTRIVFPDK